MPFQLSDLNLPEDASRPVQTALSRAYLDNISASLDATNHGLAILGNPPTIPQGDTAQELHQFYVTSLQSGKTALELSNWVYPPKPPLSFVQALNAVQPLKDVAGADPYRLKKLFADLQRRPIGRPHQRQTFIRAFEFMLLSKANSQGQAVKKFCRCGAQAHTVKCEQALKAGMRSLKKVLRKHAPDLVSRYDVLHPDRSKKVNG
jgi:hypothetical protein